MGVISFIVACIVTTLELDANEYKSPKRWLQTATAQQLVTQVNSLRLLVMFPKVALVAFSLAAIAFGQQVGTLTAESHPTLSVQ